MTEEMKEAQAAGAANTGQSAGGDASQSQSQTRTYTDADIAKARRKAERERDDALAELTKMREASKSAEERAIEEAYKRGKTETETQYQARLNDERIDSAIRRKLIESGLDEDQAFVIRAKNKDLESVEDAIAKATEYADSWREKHPEPKPRVPGQGGAPAPAPTIGEWSSSRVRKLSRIDAIKNHDAIEAAKAAGKFTYD